MKKIFCSEIVCITNQTELLKCILKSFTTDRPQEFVCFELQFLVISTDLYISDNSTMLSKMLKFCIFEMFLNK